MELSVPCEQQVLPSRGNSPLQDGSPPGTHAVDESSAFPAKHDAVLPEFGNLFVEGSRAVGRESVQLLLGRGGGLYPDQGY